MVYLGRWDETLKKDKESYLPDSSSEGQDSGIELFDSGSNSGSSGQSQDRDEIDVGEVNNEVEATSDMFEEDYDANSDYDTTSDTELLEGIRNINGHKPPPKSQIIKFMR